MKRALYFITIIALSVFFASCEKTEDFDTRWKDGNEAQFANIERDASYTKLESASKNGFIMYKEITDGKTGIRPTFEKTVKILYTGWYKNDWTKGDTYTDNDGNIIKNRIIFDSTNLESNGTPKVNISPKDLAIATSVDGFATALQHMELGDKWEIWIPWNLGYGAFDDRYSGIRGHTTLVFEVELEKIL